MHHRSTHRASLFVMEWAGAGRGSGLRTDPTTVKIGISAPLSRLSSAAGAWRDRNGDLAIHAAMGPAKEDTHMNNAVAFGTDEGW
jgi:hypothetical protein